MGPTEPADPTDPQGSYACLNNAAGWSNVYIYYWNGNQNNAAWPGEQLTETDKDAAGNYVVYIAGNYIGTGTESGVIFNNGSGTQSADLQLGLGETKIYNNQSGAWEDYDTSAIQFKSYGTDVSSPQYKGTDITVSAEAVGGEGAISYRFSVKSGSEETVLSDYTESRKSVVWTPAEAGSYTIVIEVKDEAGNENSRTLAYEIEDDAQSVAPVLKGISPQGGSEILVNESTTIRVNASGGMTGTNLLFYKVAVTAPDGSAVNTVYYKTGNTLTFQAAQKGTYTVEVSVQNSANTTVKRTYTDESVGELAPTEDPIVQSFTANKTSPVIAGTAVLLSAQGSQGTAPYQYQYSVNGEVVRSYSTDRQYTWTPDEAGEYTLKVTIRDAAGKTAEKSMQFSVEGTTAEIVRGDVDLNGKVELEDVLELQKYIAKMTVLSEEQLLRAKVTDDGKEPNLNDVLKIQKYLAKSIGEL